MSELFNRAEEFLQLFRRGAEFTRELMRENERLRHRILDLESGQQAAADDPDEWEKLRSELVARVATLEERHDEVLQQLDRMEQENRQFAERYVEFEEENNALANLYVASYQLHSTLEMGEVLKIVLEIVINLVGAERFAVYVFDEKAQELVPVAAEGQAVEDLPKVTLGAGSIGCALETGETVYGSVTGFRGLDEPMVAIPLRVERTLIGAIAIHALLEQKTSFTSLDRELFTLLAGHAATAICAARLHSQSERKLNTIRGFIDLLTK